MIILLYDPLVQCLSLKATLKVLARIAVNSVLGWGRLTPVLLAILPLLGTEMRTLGIYQLLVEGDP